MDDRQYPPPPYARPPRAPVALTLLIVAVGVWLLFSRQLTCSNRTAPAEPRAVIPRGDLTNEEKTTIEIFQNSSRSVVYVTSIATRSDFFGLNVEKIPQGTGSGFVWDHDGHIVTNFHVVRGASELEVTLADHSTYRADVVGAAPERDLAVLRIDAPGDKLVPIPVGTSSDLQVGQKVFAIGNPFGLDQTLTTGIVSALGRSIESDNGQSIEGVIQTDAAINPGNSGGPLLDSAGRLIGVNTAIYSTSGSSAGIGFAMPVDTVNQVIPELIAHGRLIRPQLGVELAHDSILRRERIQGVLIFRVEPGSGADEAGLRGFQRARDGSIIVGDIITKLDDTRIASSGDLLKTLEQYKGGDEVTVTFIRGSKVMTTRVRLQGPA